MPPINLVLLQMYLLAALKEEDLNKMQSILQDGDTDIDVNATDEVSAVQYRCMYHVRRNHNTQDGLINCSVYAPSLVINMSYVILLFVCAQKSMTTCNVLVGQGRLSLSWKDSLNVV